MKYLLMVIWSLFLIVMALVISVLSLLYRLVLYPLWNLHWHPKPCALRPEEMRSLKEVLREVWTDEPLFYPGWTEGLTMQQVQAKVHKHTASWFAYCKQQGSYNPQ